MKTVRYGLIAFFCLGATWGIAHLSTLSSTDALSRSSLSIAHAADGRAQGRWRFLPVLR